MKQEVGFEGLSVQCLIGVYPHEREQEQELLVDLLCEGDWSASFESDDVAEALDYDRLSQEIAAILKAGRFQLLESAAYAAAVHALKQRGVQKVHVLLKKPEALKNASFSRFSLTLP